MVSAAAGGWAVRTGARNSRRSLRQVQARSSAPLACRSSCNAATTRTMAREWADWFTLTRMPPVRIPDFNMSSVSPAS